MFDSRRSALLVPLLLLAACASPESIPPVLVRPAAAPPPVLPIPTPGLTNVMGKTAGTLQTLFGRPDLDIEEGYARKLQFGNGICVLDAYLYPPARGGDAIVTHVDTRLPDGRDYDSASCVAALTRRPSVP